MNTPFLEELAYQPTSMGDLVLQRRRIAALDNVEVLEVKLGDEYLMSSLFHVAEDALAAKGLEVLDARDSLEVVVGGLGLGYTAWAALQVPGVSRLIVVEALGPVIDWHRQGLIPNGTLLSADSRCAFQPGDFFSMVRGQGFDPEIPGHRVDAVLLDIDHSPRHVLADSHQDFYTVEGLRLLSRFLKPGGVFGLWSDDPPDPAFLAILHQVFSWVEGREIPFDNPLTGGRSLNGLYLAKTSLSPTAAS